MAIEQNAERLVLVTGATGRQGGAVARNLLGRGFRVRALTRDPQKPSARSLAEHGVEIVRGDLDDRSSVDLALDSVYGVFSVQNPIEAGMEGEIRQGKTLADAAKAAGLKHFVYSSMGSAHRVTGIPTFESKWEVEEHIRGTGLPYTVLRPVFFIAELGDDARSDPRGYPRSAARPGQAATADLHRGYRRLRSDGLR